MPKRKIAIAGLLICCFGASAKIILAQQTPAAQPLNALVSDFGTSFIFDPPPICPKCIETELGFLSLEDGRYIPAVVSLAPFSTHTDFNVLVNMLDSESPAGRRTTHFGNRFDFVIRQQIFQKGGFLLTAAPRGTVFVRGIDGGRAGGSLAPQYSKGNNLIGANFTWTGAVDVSAANPRSDFVDGFDYFRTLDHRGTTLFLGFENEDAAGQQTVATEVGLELPFRNGQVELSTQQLNLNNNPAWQFQARVIVNWDRVFAKR